MSDRTSLRFSGVVTALSPISHLGSQRTGTVTTLNRQKFIQPDGSVEDVPIISGNSFRGQLRDSGMRFMLEAIGLRVDLPVFHLLFSGGILTRADTSTINVRTGDYRRLRELVPLLSVFGGAVAGQIMAGKLDVGQFLPICAETAHLLPDGALPAEGTMPSVYDYLGIVEFTRTDDSKQETYRHLMAPTVVALLEGESVPGEDGPATQQMRYGTEVFGSGTRFWHEMALRNVTNLEREAFFSALQVFSERPVLGGKGAIGLGRVRFAYEQMTIEPSLMQRGTEVAFGVGQEYIAHLQANAGEIATLLARMAG